MDLESKELIVNNRFCSLLLFVVVAGLALPSLAREKIVIVPAHPDDLISSIGFCLLARERFDIHVVDLTHGERGLGDAKFKSGETKRIRMAEEQSVCTALGAELHWLDEVDGEAYARPETCQGLADLLKNLHPRAVFAHWPVDVHGDHVMAGAVVLKAVFLAKLNPEVYFFDEEYQAKCFEPDCFVDISDVAERKYEILRQYKCQYFDGGIESRKRAADLVFGLHTAALARGVAEGFRAMFPRMQGEHDIFSELRKSPRSQPKFQGARTDDWHARLPRPVFDENPKLSDFYDRAWELAHERIDTVIGIPAPRYMDEAHRSDRVWIWDTCFMAHFCKYCPGEFPGIESLDNFYGIVLADRNAPLPKVKGNRWCGENEGKMLDFLVHHPDNPPLFAWTEYTYALQTGDRMRLEKVYLEKRWLQRWYELFGSFDPSAARLYGAACKVMSKKENDGYRWGGCPSGMDNTPRGRMDAKVPSSPGCCPDNPDLLWIDALSQQGLSALCLSRIATLLGRPDEAKEWQTKHEKIRAKINELYWDDGDGFYYDILARDRSKCKVPTMASYWPLLAEIPNATQRARLVEKLRDDSWFGGRIPMPSLARKDVDFCPTGGYWRGGVWMPTTYMTIKGLDRYGEHDLARELAKKTLLDMYETWVANEPHTIWEAYSPTEAKPATYAKKEGVTARPDFCGWSALGPISLFIEDVIGIKQANAFTNTLVCEFEKKLKGRVGVENYRFGGVVCSVVATEGTIKVVSNMPFTLVADGRQFEVRAGENEFPR